MKTNRSNKSFSNTRSELADYLRRPEAKNNPIPFKRVLEELLSKSTIDSRKLAEGIDVYGLSQDDLITGNQGKRKGVENIKGRFLT